MKIKLRESFRLRSKLRLRQVETERERFIGTYSKGDTVQTYN